MIGLAFLVPNIKQEQTLADAEQIGDFPFVTAEKKCLTDNIYHEARGEGVIGWKAVAAVTINRTRHYNFPDTICKVVYQKGQFSWTSRRKRLSVREKKLYSEIDKFVQVVYNEHMVKGKPFNHELPAWINRSLFYRVGFWKTANAEMLGKIGRHNFYGRL